MHVVDLVWPGGEHPFALDIGGLRAIQDATQRGPMEVYTALGSGTWRVDDVLSVLRHGLIGGGMEPAKAKELVARMADTSSLLKLSLTAHIVISDALLGPPTDPVGNVPGETMGAAAPQVS